MNGRGRFIGYSLMIVKRLKGYFFPKTANDPQREHTHTHTNTDNSAHDSTLCNLLDKMFRGKIIIRNIT